MNGQPDQNQPAPDPIDYHGRDKADPSTWPGPLPPIWEDPPPDLPKKAAKKAAAVPKDEE